MLPSDNGIEIPTSSGSDAGVKHQTQGWARTAQVAMPGEASGDAMLAKITPGRNAAFGRRQKRSQSANAGQSHFVRPVFASQRQVPLRRQKDPLYA